LGTLLGQAVGWRGSFGVVVAIGVVVLVVAVAVLPPVPTSRESRAVGQARYAFAPRVLAVLGVGLLMFAGIQSALTYLVPFLQQVTGISGPGVSAFLLTYGVATAVGSFTGGRFADSDAACALIVGTIGVTGSLVAMWFLGANPVLMALSVLCVGLCGMGIAPSIQHRVVSLAGPGAPLASSLPASAVNVGIAAGSFAGGLAIDRGGLSAAVLTGALIAGVAVVAAGATRVLRPMSAPAAEPAPSLST
jgi:DHA1 family inner membrane transport protein